ncbi:hypothetical protein GN244_ATG20344 [Phytophthora infestans]|uniref:Uncharacterized protein n=1 Tax=Phytophthora infestans TaxID=4787 RepID=A0A833RMR8_PHYIN|nr:hypothetical protein GN244_ATG20344 [Phytophthora infestans]
MFLLQWGLQTHVTFLNGDAPGTIWCDQDDKLLKNSMDLQPVSELTVADAKRLGVFEGMKAPQSNVCIVERALFLWQEKHLQFAFEYYYGPHKAMFVLWSVRCSYGKKNICSLPLSITTRVDGVILRICRDTDYDKLAVGCSGTIWCDQDDKLLKNSMDLQPVSELTVADAKRLGVFEGMKAPQSNVCIVERALFLWQEKHLQFAFEYYYTGGRPHKAMFVLWSVRCSYGKKNICSLPLSITTRVDGVILRICRDTDYDKLAVVHAVGDAPGTIWCDQDDKLLKNSMDLQPVSELTVADAKRLGVFEGMKAPQSNVCIVERALFLWQEKTFAVLQWGLQTHVTFLNGDAPGTIWCDQDDKLLKNSMDLQPVSELTVADAKRLGVFEGMKA